jgi:phage baseplate assembly protein gpV
MTTRPAGASLIFLALIAIIITPGVPFAASAESGEGPRGRRLAQTNSVPTPDLHLVADDITDVDSSNLVQSWSDHTGNGLSLSSFVAAPKLVDGDDISTGALFNGHKAVRFGESGITGLSLPTSALQLSTSLEGMTVVAVISTDRRDALDPILFDRGYKGNRGFGIVISPAKVHMYSAMDHGGTPTTNTAAPIENGEIYVVTTQYKFAKSGVSGYQLATTQHGNLSNPDLINVTAHTWTGTGVDYSTPFVIGTQSKSDSRTSWRWLEGYVAEFRYYLQVLDQDELTAIQDGLLAKYRVEYLQRAKLTAGDGTAGNEFGVSVSINGDTMVVGAHVVDAYTGSVYVFTRDTAGDLASRWTQVAKLTAGDGTAGDWFGESVSINGDTMVVGAHGADAYTGYAYVFTRDTAGDLTSGWTQVAKLTADDGAVEDYFGSSVSIDGNTVVVGANGDDDNESSSGSAYVFTRTTAGDLASGWTQVAKLTAGDGAVNDYFGVSASIDGDTVVIGAHGDDDDVKGDDSGSAYVFARDTADDLTSNWTQVAKLTAGDGDAGDMFGYSVSIDGNAVVIGASSQITSSASAYVFSIHFPPCDASTPPANGAVGDCTDQLLSGSTCQPACDPGYFAPEPSVCDDGVFFPAVCVRYCDASAPPANGGVGDCVEYMLGDTTCQPTCDEGYIVSGKSSCDAAGALTAAVCRELSCCERTFDKFGFGVAYSYGDEL